MGLTEKSRHELHSKLEDALGPAAAGTLMEMLPPVGWADVATKRDLDALKHELVATFRGEMNAQTRTIFFALAGILIPYGGVIFAAARLA